MIEQDLVTETRFINLQSSSPKTKKGEDKPMEDSSTYGNARKEVK